MTILSGMNIPILSPTATALSLPAQRSNFASHSTTRWLHRLHGDIGQEKNVFSVNLLTEKEARYVLYC